jgi:hypothetical protein
LSTHESEAVAAYFAAELPALLAGDRGSVAGRVAAALPPLTLQIDDRAWTHRSVDGRLVVTSGTADDAVSVRLTAAAWRDWHDQTLTVPGLLLTEAVEVAPEDIMALSHWDLAVRALWSGVPPYDRDRVDLSIDGQPVDLSRSFTLDDRDEDIAAHLETVGFVRIRGVFAPDEVDALNAEVDRLAEEAAEGDGRSWWSAQPDGGSILNRIIYAHERSEVIARLYDDARLQRLGTVLHGELVVARDRMDAATVLIKPPGELSGLANIPWHQDCGLGGHNIICPSVGVGVQLTGASAEASRFVGIAGSHGHSAHPLMTEEDLASMPLVGLDTEPGDVTLHICDVIHASPPPDGPGGRRTLYLTFFPPTLWDTIGVGESVNDMIHGRKVSPDDLAGHRR